MNKTKSVFVTGANGKLGRRVVEVLLEKKNVKVIAGSRDVTKIADLKTRGAEVRTADFEKPDTLDKAFAGVDRLLIISTDSMEGMKRFNQHKNAIAAAKKAGVKYIVYTSFPNPRPTSDSILSTDHFLTEHEVVASGIPFAIMRHTLYIEMIPMFIGKDAITAGAWTHSIQNDRGINFVSREDCAQSDAAVLSSDDSKNHIYEITGPIAEKPSELVSKVAATLKTNIKSNTIPLEKLREGMVQAMPKDMAYSFSHFWTDASEGIFLNTSSDVKKLTGRDPVSVSDALKTGKLY